jgi:threonine dehydrogenase-like Zn-dependent dehydrogenase
MRCCCACRACGICGTGSSVHHGWDRIDWPPGRTPLIIGHEPSGEVVRQPAAHDRLEGPAIAYSFDPTVYCGRCAVLPHPAR